MNSCFLSQLIVIFSIWLKNRNFFKFLIFKGKSFQIVSVTFKFAINSLFFRALNPLKSTLTVQNTKVFFQNIFIFRKRKLQSTNRTNRTLNYQGKLKSLLQVWIVTTRSYLHRFWNVFGSFLHRFGSKFDIQGVPRNMTIGEQF